MRYLIGCDIGGTTFSSSIFTENLQKIESSNKELVDSNDDTNTFLNKIKNQILSLAENRDKKDFIGVGVSCPGPLNSEKGIVFNTPNLKQIQNINIKNKISDLVSMPVTIDNDANLFTLGEYLQYNGNNKVIGGITIGTGLGFGIIVNGEIFTGGNGMAAEYGISPINDSECWESSLSIRGLENLTIKYFGPESKIFSPKELCNMAINSDITAIKIWNEFGQNLGMVISHFINLIDPNTIIIGGGISNAFNLFEKKLKETLLKHSPSYEKNKISIIESTKKEYSSQLGAAAIAHKKIILQNNKSMEIINEN